MIEIVDRGDIVDVLTTTRPAKLVAWATADGPTWTVRYRPPYGRLPHESRYATKDKAMALLRRVARRTLLADETLLGVGVPRWPAGVPATSATTQ